MKAISVASLLVAAVGPCIAQKIDPIAPNKGAYSISFSADWARGQRGSIDSNFVVTPAYFVTDCLQVRVPLAFHNNFGLRETIVGLGVDWHFLKHRGQSNSLLDPFLGAVAEHAAASGFRQDFVGGRLGMNYFVARNVAVAAILTVGTDRASGASETTTNLTSGFTIFFAGK